MFTVLFEVELSVEVLGLGVGVGGFGFFLSKGLKERIALNSSGVKSEYSFMAKAYPAYVALCFLTISQFLTNYAYL